MKEQVEKRISKRLKLIEVHIDHIFLDPNNLRLAGSRRPTPERRFLESGVQNSVQSDMEEFDLDTLKTSFLQEGVLPLDKIVVTRYKNSNNYIVAEGNRRIAAIKALIDENSRGVTQIPKYRLQELKTLEVFLLENATKQDTLLIQGIRHVPGIKEWGAYEKASAVSYLLDRGYSPEQVSDIMGGIIRPGEVARYYNAFGAIQQMRADDEYGRLFDPNYFTYFDELLKPKFLEIRKWLDWDSAQRKFRNEENLNAFYKWITGDGKPDKRQIHSVVELRKLPDVFDNTAAKHELFDGESVEHASSMILVPSEWRKKLDEFQSFIKNEIPLAEDFTTDDVEKLAEIRNLIQKIIERIE